MADLDRINDLIRAARTNWFGLLAYLAFVGVTLMGVQDADFFITERETTLPLIGVDIPTFLFFWVAPALGAALYAYLHLNLLRLWEAIADHRRSRDLPLWDAAGETAPGVAHGPLVNQTVPWLVTDHALTGTSDGAPPGRPMRGLANLVTWLLTYAAGPAILAAFFWRSMPAHDEALTVIGCALPLWVALYAGLTSAHHRRACLTGASPRRWLHRPVLWTAGIGLPLLGWLTTEGTLDHYVRQLNREPAELRQTLIEEIENQDNELYAPPEVKNREWRVAPFATALNWSVRRLGYVPVDEDRLGRDWRQSPWQAPADPPKAVWSGMPLPALLVRADLANVDFVNIPDDWRDFETARKAYRIDWCRDRGLDHATCTEDFADHETEFAADWKTERTALLGTLTARSLASRDFRGADLRGARLEGADLREARMEGADLREARMEGADLIRARMERADLRSARMEGADLRYALLEGALLFDARMEGADFSDVRMEAASLVDARMAKVVLENAKMQGVDLRGAWLEEANLGGAHMAAADLRQARMKGADLSHAELEWAELDGAIMKGTVLNAASFKAAVFDFAEMEGAVLDSARIEGALFSRVVLDEKTSFKPATLRGAGLKDVNVRIPQTDIGALPRMLAEAFGDASVILPDGLEAGEPPLEHWSTEILDWPDFEAAWRDHQAAIGYTPLAQ